MSTIIFLASGDKMLNSEIKNKTVNEHEDGDCGCGCHEHEDGDCGCHEHEDGDCGCHEHEDGDCGCGCHEHEDGDGGCGCHEHEDDDCGCGCHEHEDGGCGCGCHEHEYHHHGHGDCACHEHCHEQAGLEHEHEPNDSVPVHHHHVPGHPASCRCELCYPHEDYCDVCGESLANCTCRMPDADVMKRVYILENLGCANCAAKMERMIRELPGVRYATITFATKQLRLSAEDHEKILPEIRRICASVEPDVKVVLRGHMPGAVRSKVYILENLGCADCAARMERKISELPGVISADIAFATRQLRVTAQSPERLEPELLKICTSIEPEVRLVARDSAQGRSESMQLDPAAETEEKKLRFSDGRGALVQLIAGAALFAAGKISELLGAPLPVYLAVYIAAYLLLGGKILLTAGKNLLHGRIFDENFLMSLATLGAFAIGSWPEAVGVMLFFRVGEYFEDKAVEKSRGQIMEAVDLRPETVNLLIGEDVTVIPAADAQVGDVLLVRPGDRIPLDGVIIDGTSRLDTSAITGEPVPVAVGYGDEITSGCVNLSGRLTLRVERQLEESMVTKILDSVENAAASKPRIDRFITRFSRVYTPAVVLIALITAIVPPLVSGGGWQRWIYTALSFLVMSCPCALVLSVPLAFFAGIGAGSKRGILFKGGASIEALKNVRAVVMDKTGTITKGTFEVRGVVPAGDMTEDELLALCAAAESSSTHPVAASIAAAARERGISVAAPENIEELAGFGIRAVCGDKTVLCGNRRLLEKFSVAVPDISDGEGGTEVLCAVNGAFAGCLVISDVIKPEAKGAIAEIKRRGAAAVMLTGDTEKSARAVAAETGIDDVRARLLPQNKLEEMQRLREGYGPVMFVGDGINDAPVLAGADVGAAMGSGADAAIEAADVVFMTSSMDAIPQSMSIARSAANTSYFNVVFALAIKLAVMLLGLTGHASMWAAVFADSGVALLCVLNSVRILYKKH